MSHPLLCQCLQCRTIGVEPPTPAMVEAPPNPVAPKTDTPATQIPEDLKAFYERALTYGTGMYSGVWPEAARLIERIATLESTLAAERASREQAEEELLKLHTLRPRSEYHEDYGVVLWHRVPICEPPVVDGYDIDDLDWSYTHWSPIPMNPEVAKPSVSPEQAEEKQ